MEPTPENIERVQIRSYQPEDHATVSRLYTDGLLTGQIAPNDTGADIENIQEAYFTEDANHFWVAELDDAILGMIGVARDREHTAEIRRLRVEKDWQHTDIAERLIETALTFCKHHQYLKIVLDTRASTQSRAKELFDRFSFQHTRTRIAQGKDLLEFYLDLYRPPKQKEDG